MSNEPEMAPFEEGVLYRCGACNYKFPAEMAGRPTGGYECPSCRVPIVRFSSYDEATYEFIAHTESDRFSFEGDQD